MDELKFFSLENKKLRQDLAGANERTCAAEAKTTAAEAKATAAQVKATAAQAKSTAGETRLTTALARVHELELAAAGAQTASPAVKSERLSFCIGNGHRNVHGKDFSDLQEGLAAQTSLKANFSGSKMTQMTWQHVQTKCSGFGVNREQFRRIKFVSISRSILAVFPAYLEKCPSCKERSGHTPICGARPGALSTSTKKLQMGTGLNLNRSRDVW